MGRRLSSCWQMHKKTYSYVNITNLQFHHFMVKGIEFLSFHFQAALLLHYLKINYWPRMFILIKLHFIKITEMWKQKSGSHCLSPQALSVAEWLLLLRGASRSLVPALPEHAAAGCPCAPEAERGTQPRTSHLGGGAGRSNLGLGRRQ